MSKKYIRGNVFLIILILGVIAIGAYFILGKGFGKDTKTSNLSTSTDKVKLVYAVHWSEKPQLEGLQKYLDEYTKLHPNVEFEVKKIAYNDYANKLKILSDADAAPDIYQIYAPWGVSYVKEGILDTPPTEVINDVKKNYVSTAGVTIGGNVWGIPTEINDYSLLYNKNLFKDAGISDPPKTWNDLVSLAQKLTKKDSKGKISQYGIAFLKGNDWQVVDPFLSLLFSNGGEYLSSDNTKALFNSAKGVEALEAELSLFKNGSTDINGNTFDFGKGKVAMVIAPPWTKGSFKTAFGDKFESSVGVSPFPYLVKPSSLQYSWFMGVMAKSKHKKEAWDFLTWFSSETPIFGTTRYGDLLSNVIGAIPSRKVDFDSHKDVLGDFFTKVYVSQMENAVAEPNVLQASSVKAALMKEIESAWAGNKTAKEALDAAAVAVNKILSQNSK